jgi:hypothetical protein
MSYQKVNYKVHVEICKKMFSQVQVSKGVKVVSTPIQESISYIYTGTSIVVYNVFYFSDLSSLP